MAADMFLKIDGIDGDSSGHKHKGEIEILSYSWGITNKTSPIGGGGGAGKPVVQDFTVVTEIGGSSPQLMEKCCSGEHIQSVSLTVASKDTRQEYLKIKLEDCLISSYQTGAGGGSVPMDQVSFSFRSVDIQAADRQGQFHQVSCDFLKNTTDGTVGHDH